VKGLLALALLLPAAALSEEMPTPFGIALGEPLPEGFEAKFDCRPPGAHSLGCDAAPVLVEPFDEFMVLLTPDRRVAKVGAFATIENDAYGLRALTWVKKLHEAVTAKWGKATTDYDFVQPRSIWSEARDFAMALKTRQRTKMSFWVRQEYSIQLGLNGATSTSITLVLAYEHTAQMEVFAAAKTAKEAGGL